jgi:hypothetical protein
LIAANENHKRGETKMQNQPRPAIYDTVAVEVFGFKFWTDSEHGEIVARDFTEAKFMLFDMVSSDALDDGGCGWVEDMDGTRFTIGDDE